MRSESAWRLDRAQVALKAENNDVADLPFGDLQRRGTAHLCSSHFPNIVIQFADLTL